MCNCKVCEGETPEYLDVEDEHSVCACGYCHTEGLHESALDWEGGCIVCAVMVKEAQYERTNDLQNGDLL
jgi:hypothetical protein